MRVLFTLALAMASVAFAEQGPVLVDNHLNILSDAKGMTAYVFDRDTAVASNCNGGCAVEWPPIAAPADAQVEAPFSVIVRKDNSRQMAYKNRPLYLYRGDSAPGDINGDNYSSVWHVARP